MGDLAHAFVEFLGRVHDASTAIGGAKATAEQAVTEAAAKVTNLYNAYVPAEPEDVHDASAAKLIDKVVDLEMFAACVMS